ncbi:MAG TPA: CHAT domain-containing protein [Longimicrobium sp.]|nr:CHAT domain-containing protein [Longimicrobium sp.]
MRKVKVLFFAADAHSILADGSTQRLLLDEEVRQIQENLRAAGRPKALEFDYRLAARIGDLVQALRRTRPQVVHFSGHGQTEGLVLVARDGVRPHLVRAEALVQLFGQSGGEVRVVVLNACFSLPQAEAIAQAVGCAIGTRRRISDEAAIAFSAAFYGAIASGASVQAAYDEARLALKLEHFGEHECLAVARRADVDPARLVLTAPWWRRLVPRRAGAAAAAFALAFALVFCPSVPPEATVSDITCGMDTVAASTTPADRSTAAANLDRARELYHDRKYARAASLFEVAASAGSSEAMACLGFIYFHGRPGVKPQPALGMHWLRRAASQERDAHGMYALAVAYLSDGAAQNDYLAKEWFFKAAREKGYAEAMRSLGALEQRERNAGSDRRAFDWYRRAVDAGSVDAMVDLGLMYERGLGTARDTVAALRWYRSAAARGSPRGMFAAGRSYEQGIGVPRDYAHARNWYRRAADAGSAEAMNRLGALYDHGLGVRRSRLRAACWYERAAQAGSPLSRVNRTR